MATKLDLVDIGYTWRIVQIEGTGEGTIANYISFEVPTEGRRAEVVTSTPVDNIQIIIDLDGTGNPEQQMILAQTAPVSAIPILAPVKGGYTTLTHDAPFSFQLPQTTVKESPNRQGKIYLTTIGVGGGKWTLSVEVRG